MAAHSSILAWRIPWEEEPGRLHGVARVRHDLATKESFTMPFFFLVVVRKGIDTDLIFCYEKFQIQQNRGNRKNGLPLNFNETIPFDQDKVRTLHLVDKFV